MSVSQDMVLRLADMIYDAALDERKWPVFLNAFAQAVDGCSAMLRLVDGEVGAADFVAGIGYDPAWQSAYGEHFIKPDYLTPTLNPFA